MQAATAQPAHTSDDDRSATRARRWKWVQRRWILVNSLLAGAFALAWLLLRSGAKPSRFAYPCQQAAFSAATLAFGAPLVAALLSARRHLVRQLRTPFGLAAAASGLVLTAGAWTYWSRADAYQGPGLEPRDGYQAQLFHVSECPQDPIGTRFVGLDNLINLMGSGGLKFYESATETLVSGPDGLLAAADTVVVKINYQWDQRGGTNVDVLRGLVQRIVDHPDTFAGEIVVCENAQFASVSNFDRSNNNAQDHGLSPHDVVTEFQDLGYTISHFDWTAIRGTSVSEYSDGDMTSGYIVYDYDPVIHGRVSYPKFLTDYGTAISLKYGVWNGEAGTYDRPRLKFINVPVLKSHSATYGATACVKNYMGTVTGLLSTDSHDAIRYGIMGALLGEIQLADLNLLDCIWINANPFDGPWTSYAAATRRDELVASVDPVATDIWAVTNILIPAFLENGYSPPWPNPSADPEDPNSDFRQYLDHSLDQILMAGYDATNDLEQIDAYTWNGAGDFDGDSDIDLDDFAALMACIGEPDAPAPPVCQGFDFDSDLDVDSQDWGRFQTLFTGPGIFGS